jgi:hypothetical protein
MRVIRARPPWIRPDLVCLRVKFRRGHRRIINEQKYEKNGEQLRGQQRIIFSFELVEDVDAKANKMQNKSTQAKPSRRQ